MSKCLNKGKTKLENFQRGKGVLTKKPWIFSGTVQFDHTPQR